LRRPLPLLLLLALAPIAPVASGQEETEIIESERVETLDLATRDLLDPDPIEHMGWGTLEDVFVDLGAGAAISTLSGNVVLRFEPIPRPDLPAPARMAFTYNHIEPEGAPDLAPGWTYTWGRSWTPGPWGDRIVIDEDGFRDSLWAGEPPSAEQLDRVTRDVIAAWRRGTPARDRRALGGVSALEELLVSDPATLGNMRLRYLGAPDPDLFEELVFRSSARGVRVMQDEGKDIVLVAPDGSRDTYAPTGALTGFAPAQGLAWAAVRDQGVLDAVTVGGLTEWTLETDSRFRISKLSDARGAVTRFEYAGSLLQLVDSPNGEWRFHYDARGRLDQAKTPSGDVQITYDDSTGRAVSGSGPEGRWTMRPSLSDTGLSVLVDGDDGTYSVRWDAERRERTVTRAGRQVERVRFANRAALPTEVERASGILTLDWDDSGRLLRVAERGREVRFDRDGDGILQAIVDGGGARGPVEAAVEGVRAWDDPSGRRTTLERADDGFVRAVLRTGGPDLSIQRHSGGAMSRLAVREGPELALPSPERSVGELRLDGASAGVRRNNDGRIVGFEGPTGRTVSLVLGPGGRVREVRDDRATATVDYSGQLLAGWTGPEGARTVRRDREGRATALVEGGVARWDARRDGTGGLDRLLLDGAELLVEVDSDGAVRSWQRPGGARTELSRRGDGAVNERTDDATGALALDLDREGRVVAVRRGSGRWELGRDRSGRIERVAEPGGGLDFTLDAAGHPGSVATRSGHGWTLRRDALGRLTALEGIDASFVLEHTRAGAPTRFFRADGADARLDFDVRGRWTGLGLPEGAVSVSWGVSAPTGFGELRWRMDSAGALSGWGAMEKGELRWFVDREVDGRVRTVRGGGLERGIRRDPAGRPERVGADTLAWGYGGLDGFEANGASWRIERDGSGRVRRYLGPDATLVFDRETTGDARRITVLNGKAEGAVELGRDPAGRLDSLRFAGGLGATAWRMTRDPMGRLLTVERGERQRADLTWRDISREDEGVLAEALAVQTDDPKLRREASGSWDVQVAAGALLAQYPSRPGLGGTHGRALLLPEWVRSALPPTSLPAMRLPMPRRLEPPLMLVGDAARARRWWSGHAPRIEDLALMPEGLPEDVRAWRQARIGAVARGAGVPEDVGRAGAGVLLPPVPGAASLVPGPVGARRVTAREALVLAGDLPAEALVWGELLDLPEEAWRFDLPGAAVLAAVRRRLDAPALPPTLVADGIAVVEAGAHGLATARGREVERRRRWEAHPLIDGLPPGTLDVLPGTPGWITPLPGTTEADGRATGLDALSDDPLGAREAALGQARADSVLLALRALAGGVETALGGLLPDPAADESWLIELPSGTRVVLDGHGRLLSVDAGGRLIRALVGAMAALAGGELLAPTLDRWTLTSSGDDAPWNPLYLPGRGDAVESRWGLVPAVAGLPLDAQARPALPGWPP
jgi:hypothetical protein